MCLGLVDKGFFTNSSSEGRYTSFNEGAAGCGSHRGSQSPQQRRLSQIMAGSHSPQQRRLSQMLEQQEVSESGLPVLLRIGMS